MIWGTTHQQDYGRRLNLTYWHKWFAWRIVLLDTGRFVWLQFVERRLEYVAHYDGLDIERYYRMIK